MSRVADEAVSMTYEEFIASKLARIPATGLAVVPELNPSLFPFQADIVRWALRRGRAAVFADCGLGKTIVQLEWARHVPGPVLILAPLAVATQTVREAQRFGYDARYCRDGSATGGTKIIVANYEMLHKFDTSVFSGVVLDESGILKAFDGKTRNALVAAFRNTPFRLACTATPAPNDHVELGNHAAFLGVSTREEMMAEYFINDGGDTSKWRLKGHAVAAFWDWVASWSVAVRKPSDLGYPDDGYDLPGLDIRHHIIESGAALTLFDAPAHGLTEQRAAKRESISDRAAHVASLVAAEPGEQWIVWVELNGEGDAVTAAIPGAVQISGSDPSEVKEQRLVDFIEGRTRVLVSKSSISGFGINLQNCARMIFASVTHSYEAFFQAIRRCHRFGQLRRVIAHLVCSQREIEVLESLQRKEADCERMMTQMVALMRATQMGAVRGTNPGLRAAYKRPVIETPSWLRSA